MLSKCVLATNRESVISRSFWCFARDFERIAEWEISCALRLATWHETECPVQNYSWAQHYVQDSDHFKKGSFLQTYTEPALDGNLCRHSSRHTMLTHEISCGNNETID